jgi:hypothetical protein
MLCAKDMAAGCMAVLFILAAAVLIPIFLLFFKFSLLVAIPMGLIIGAFFSVAVLGKLIRVIFSGKN